MKLENDILLQMIHGYVIGGMDRLNTIHDVLRDLSGAEDMIIKLAKQMDVNPLPYVSEMYHQYMSNWVDTCNARYQRLRGDETY